MHKSNRKKNDQGPNQNVRTIDVEQVRCLCNFLEMQSSEHSAEDTVDAGSAFPIST